MLQLWGVPVVILNQGQIRQTPLIYSDAMSSTGMDSSFNVVRCFVMA
jgi:hypothetical protein